MPKRFKFMTTLVAMLSLLYSSNLSAQILLDSTSIDTSTLISGLETPWEMLWGPDDHIWLTERSGFVSRINPTTGTRQQILDISSMISSSTESGLLGMVLHPDFVNSSYVYLSYNFHNGSAVKLAIVRYLYDGVNLINPQILIDSIHGNNNHNGSRLVISSDLKLFVSTGDAVVSSNALDINSLNGKILRFNLDGTIPTDNPYPNSAVWSTGHRNPQGLAFGPNGLLYSAEHGPSSDDEFQIIRKGKKYGWPLIWGFCDLTNPFEAPNCGDTNFIDPLIAWSPTIAPSDIYWVSHPSIPEWENTFLVAGLKSKMLACVRLDGTGEVVLSQNNYLQSKFGRIRDICGAPDGRIFIATNGQSFGGSPPSTNKIIVLKNPNYMPVGICQPPLYARSQKLNTNTVRLSWIVSANANSYRITGKPIAGSSYVSLDIPDGTSSFKNITNLDPSVTYVWGVKAMCPDGPTTYSNIDTFKLGDSLDCLPPDSISHEVLSQSKVKLKWDAVPNAIAYHITGRKSGAGNYANITVNAPATQLTVNNLLSGQLYEWAVRSTCTSVPGFISNYSGIGTFSLPIVSKKSAIKSESSTIVEVYPNPATDRIGFLFKGVDIVNYNLYITDMKGIQIKSFEYQTNKHLVFNIDDLNPGVYYYQILRTNDKMIVGKLIKL